MNPRDFFDFLVSTKIKPLFLTCRKKPALYQLLLSGEPFNAHTVKDRLVNGLSKAITFDELMDEYLSRMKSLKGQSYYQPTIIKYRNTQLRIIDSLTYSINFVMQLDGKYPPRYLF